MNIAVFGTGQVGRQLATRLLSQGHHVTLASRAGNNEASTTWKAQAGERAAIGTFADAAAQADFVFLAIPGTHAVAAVESAKDALAGKVLLDLSNPLDFSKGFPPRLTVCNDDSVGEQVQRAVPETKVVKVLNTLTNTLMLDPGKLPEPTDLILCGNDTGAKGQVAELLGTFGWGQPIDLGDISNARGMEMWLPLWVRLYGALGTGEFNLRIVKA